MFIIPIYLQKYNCLQKFIFFLFQFCFLNLLFQKLLCIFHEFKNPFDQNALFYWVVFMKGKKRQLPFQRYVAEGGEPYGNT